MFLGKGKHKETPVTITFVHTIQYFAKQNVAIHHFSIQHMSLQHLFIQHLSMQYLFLGHHKSLWVTPPEVKLKLIIFCPNFKGLFEPPINDSKCHCEIFQLWNVVYFYLFLIRFWVNLKGRLMELVSKCYRGVLMQSCKKLLSWYIGYNIFLKDNLNIFYQLLIWVLAHIKFLPNSATPA